ncbi:MAG: GGDEF domain-containing protein [Spirochaetes bacterium]|nr:GGDEF domain-containing protein [Spirochaetota bacterium]
MSNYKELSSLAFLIIPLLIFIIFCIFVILISRSRAVKLYLRLIALIRSLPDIHIHSLSDAKNISNMFAKMGYFEQIISVYQSKIRARYRHLDSNSMIQTVLLSLNNLHIEMDNRNEFFKAVLESAITVIPQADSGALLVLDCDGILHYEAVIGFDIANVLPVELKKTEIYKRNKTHIFEPCIIRSAFSDNNRDETQDFHSAVCAPINIEGNLFGVLVINSIDENAFGEDDLVLISYFANEVSLLIRTHNRIQKAIFNSKYDSLTGVYTRGYFEDLCKVTMDQAYRGGLPLQIVLIDLNDFKMINDTYGHSAGDNALKFFASEYIALKREADLFCRYGGDEFVALFFNCDMDGVSLFFELLEETLRKNTFSAADTSLNISISWGCASVHRDGETLTELVNCADKRMYEDKRRRKKVI